MSKTTPIRSVLVANRGEIAVRVIDACRELGIATVAVYSEADRGARHVLAADRAVEIGPAPPRESYLDIERIIAAARETDCDAVHPGYGFLSENARFARACREAGLIFIGPSAESMELVGDKLAARATMEKAGVPITPGAEIHDQSWAEIARIAGEIGYPVMVKAAAGGGGKGMRVVDGPDGLRDAVEAGRREAGSAFGDDTVYIEKYLTRPRHVEVQVLADHHGHTVHLFERECSIQRRHQKIVEESPSPALDPELRRNMGETACRVMEAVNYANAGTVEFLLDAERNFYFLEVNARIQVEHPVTEMVTGVDLVQHQIRVAEGHPLAFRQADLTQRGHAIECRIYAEDPESGFLPSTGDLLFVKEPAGPGVRCDSGIVTGMTVSHHYDPILAKLIVYAETREAAIRRMRRALADYVILGVRTPIDFLRDLLAHPAFADGDIDTGFIGKHMADWAPESDGDSRPVALLAAASTRGPRRRGGEGAGPRPTPWQSVGDWTLSGPTP